MTIEVKLPSLGEGVESGDVVDIKVSEGDVITKNQGILDLETDKATVEVPSAHAGKVVKIHVAKGQTISVGAVLLSLEGSTAPAIPNQPVPKQPATLASAPTPSTPAPKTEPVAPAPPVQPIVPATAVAQATTEFTASGPARTAAPVAVASDSSSTYSEVPAAGPAVRRFAREAGIDLTRLAGSGSGGRITRDDVLDAVRSGGITPATLPSPAKPREQQVTPVVSDSVADSNDGSGADK